MGSCCGCCEDNTVIPEPVSFWDSAAVTMTRPTRPPPLQSVGVHQMCTCRTRAPRHCPAPPEGNHHCRCLMAKRGKPAVCISEKHHCICHLPDPPIVCQQHMTRTSVSLESPSSCPICLTPLSTERVVVRLRVCGHYFHCECLKAWFKQGRRQCPLCMRTVQIT